MARWRGWDEDGERLEEPCGWAGKILLAFDCWCLAECLSLAACDPLQRRKGLKEEKKRNFAHLGLIVGALGSLTAVGLALSSRVERETGALFTHRVGAKHITCDGSALTGGSSSPPRCKPQRGHCEMPPRLLVPPKAHPAAGRGCAERWDRKNLHLEAPCQCSNCSLCSVRSPPGLPQGPRRLGELDEALCLVQSDLWGAANPFCCLWPRRGQPLHGSVWLNCSESFSRARRSEVCGGQVS